MTAGLPAILNEIADLVGEVAALQIAALKGGQRIYIPTRAAETHWLAQAIGGEKAKKLCDHYAGAQVDIPLHVGGTYKQLLRSIAERAHKIDSEENVSSNELSRRLGITRRSVHRHRARHRGRRNKDQGRLF